MPKTISSLDAEEISYFSYLHFFSSFFFFFVII